jgi:hypothetical protein
VLASYEAAFGWHSGLRRGLGPDDVQKPGLLPFAELFRGFLPEDRGAARLQSIPVTPTYFCSTPDYWNLLKKEPFCFSRRV